MIFHRSNVFRPARDVLNFFVYRKYIKKFDVETVEGRKWLDELRRNINYMGFNDGVETFETHYEATQRVGRSMVQSELRKQALVQKALERDLKYARMFAEQDAKVAERKAKEDLQKRRTAVVRSEYNPNWKPTAEKLRSRNPIDVREGYVGLVRKVYDIADHGQYAVSLSLHGKTPEIFSGKTSLEANGKATRRESEIARIYNLPRNEVKSYNPSVTHNSTTHNNGGNQSTATREPDFDIDISHVNRAMGNGGSNQGSNDLDDLLNDIF